LDKAIQDASHKRNSISLLSYFLIYVIFAGMTDFKEFLL